MYKTPEDVNIGSKWPVAQIRAVALVAKGVDIDTGPIDQSWGNREMYVKDADRNSIRFTQLGRS